MKFAETIVSLFAAAIAATPAVAQADFVPIIRDAEGEAVIADMLAPIVDAAGLEPGAVHPRLVDYQTINAFVSYGQDLYLHSGVILAVDDVAQVDGILAHEIGHIAGGHAVRRDLVKRKSRTIVLGHMLLGAGMVAADPNLWEEAVVAVGAGYQLRANYMAAYDRRQEYAADQAAITYLKRAGLPADGLVAVFQRTLSPDNSRASTALKLYLRSHPDMEDRVRVLESRVAEAAAPAPIDPALVARYRLFRAKMLGHAYGPEAVEGRYYDQLESREARYAKANALYGVGELDDALAMARTLTSEAGASAYFHELEGNILLRLGRADEAIPPLVKANALAPNTPLIMIQESAARLMAAPDPDAARTARAVLEAATALDTEIVAGWHLLGLADHRLGDDAGASLALAEKSYLLGDDAAARHYARMAQSGLPFGSPKWLQADNLLAAVDDD